MNSARDVISRASLDDLARVERDLDRRVPVPDIYRPARLDRWQCEWPNLEEIGTFQSRILSLAVWRAQRAYVRAIRALIAERREEIATATYSSTEGSPS